MKSRPRTVYTKYIDPAVILGLVLLSILPLLNLLTPGQPLTHDGPDHVARIANFYDSLQEGISIPRWAENLNWGYGHPILMFLYPLPSYIASVFLTAGVGYIDSTKLTFGVTYVMSVVAMYLAVRQLAGRTAGILGAILYGFSPYRFVDLYVRGALGEHVAFIFPPLVLYFLFRPVALPDWRSTRTTGGRGRFVDSLLGRIWMVVRIPFRGQGFVTSGLALSMAGLILSHNAISMMMLPVLLLLFLYRLAFMEKSQRLLVLYRTMTGLLLGFLLSAFFWVPAFFEGKYTLRDIVTKGEFVTRFVPFLHFIRSKWDYGGTETLTKEIGPAHWLGVVIGLSSWFRVSDRRLRSGLALVIGIFALSLVIMTSVSTPVWQFVTILQKFQFPWRFLTVSVFAASLIAAWGVSIMPRRLAITLSVLLSMMAIGYTRPMWQAREYRVLDESHFTGIYTSTTDTGESSPIWSVRFMERKPAAQIEILSGTASIQIGDRSSTIHSYTVEADTPVRLLENTLFFPGWHVYAGGSELAIQFQDPEFRGLMTFELPAGYHEIRISFERTAVRFMSELLSTAAALYIGLQSAISLYAIMAGSKNLRRNNGSS